MRLDEFARGNALAGEILRDAAELGSRPRPTPGDHSGPYETDACFREFLNPAAEDPEAIDLRRIVDGYDCISFLDDDELFAWLPVWMCASLYAWETRKGHWENTIGWTEFAVVRALDLRRLPIHLATLDRCLAFVLDLGLDVDESLLPAVARYRLGSETDERFPTIEEMPPTPEDSGPER